MNKLVELIYYNSKNCFVTDAEILALLGADTTPNKRYALVKRALASGELIRIKRGLYCLAKKYHRVPLDLFVVAQAIYYPSYISLYSAMSYHGLIPEAVYSITSVSTKRRKSFNTPIATFDFFNVPEKNFLEGIQRIEGESGAFLIATPQKSILDFVYVFNPDWLDMKWAIEDLRINEDILMDYKLSSFEQLEHLYKDKRVGSFIKMLRKFYEY